MVLSLLILYRFLSVAGVFKSYIEYFNEFYLFIYFFGQEDYIELEHQKVLFNQNYNNKLTMLTIKLVQIGTPSRDSIVYSGYVLLVKSHMHIKYNWPNNSLCFCEATIIISTIQLGPRESKRSACARIFLSRIPYHAQQNRIVAVWGVTEPTLEVSLSIKTKMKKIY